MATCTCCGSKGRIINKVTGEWVPCPKCRGVIQEAKNLTLESLAEVDISKADYKALKIPKMYENLTYSGALLRSQAGAYFDGDVLSYIGILDRIRDGIAGHVLPEYSVYLHAPNEIDIALWVYTILKMAVDNGFTAVPYITLKELDYLISKQEDKNLYYQYINAQVCILDYSAKKDWDAVCLLADILGVRAKKGLATILTGYWSHTTLLKSNKNDGMYLLLSETEMSNGVMRCYSLTRKSTKKDAQQTVIQAEDSPSPDININMSDYSELLN